jgi:hypothetical protein
MKARAAVVLSASMNYHLRRRTVAALGKRIRMTAVRNIGQQRTAIIGGRPGSHGARTAARDYRLGCAWDDEILIVLLIEDVPGIAITFEAENFDQAFARALQISEDMAELAGHLADGVQVSLVECGSLAEIGIDTE